MVQQYGAVVTSLVYLQYRTEPAVFFLGLGKYAANPAVQGDRGGYYLNTVSGYVSSDNFVE